MRKTKKSKEQRIHEALKKLNDAINLEDPTNIRIDIQWGIGDDDRGKKFVSQINAFIKAYKKYYGIEKVKVDLVL